MPKYCTRPGSYKLDLVTGHSNYDIEYLASSQRAYAFGLDILTGTCGKRGRFWEKSSDKNSKN